MQHYPGRTTEEIVNLASDITNNAMGERLSDYVDFCMIPAAQDAIDEHGDEAVNGYSYGTVLGCARKIAHQIETLGYVDIT